MSRLVWVDLMKVIGMYFIVVGHMFPLHHEMVYAFSVPLFFMISGFLSKRYETNGVFIKKIVRCYYIPMIALTLLSSMFRWFRNSRTFDEYVYNEGKQLIFSYINGNWGGQLFGLHECWYVFTLMALLVINQFVGKKTLLFIISPLAIAISIVLRHYDIVCYNSYANLCVALPFFALGTFLKEYKDRLHSIKLSHATTTMLVVLSIFLLYIVADQNGAAYLWKNQYGDNYAIFLGGALIGIIMVFVLAKFFESYVGNNITLLAKGNLLTLAVHPIILNVYSTLHISIPYIEYFISIIIMALMLPVIKLVQTYAGWLLGEYRNLSPLQSLK